ncbi:MAG: hypothetical protein M3O30_17585 [Planctomycetota bacterium]|nr:hypothetical protein [Planctomycetota bacterium]
MLEAIEFPGGEDGGILRLESRAIGSMLSRETCTPQRISEAYRLTRQSLSQGTVRNPRAYLYKLVCQRVLTLPMSQQEKEQARKPEHVQEAESLEAEREARERADMARMKKELAAMPLEKLCARIAALADREAVAFWRDWWKQRSGGVEIASLQMCQVHALYTGNPISKPIKAEVAS